MEPLESSQRKYRSVLPFFVVFLVIVVSLFIAAWLKMRPTSDEFARLMNVGKNYYEGSETAKAIEAFQKAVALNPTHPDAHLNLANAFLLAGDSENVLKQAQEVLNLAPNSAAALYLAGCANLRLARYEPAVKALQQSKDIDPKINAVSFQLGRAHQALGHFDDAIKQFEEVIQFEPDHPAANYVLSQVLLRAGRTAEASQALELHQKIAAQKAGQPNDPATYERCDYTKARVPFQLEQPAKQSVKVVFADATQFAFGSAAKNYHGPVGVLDIDHRGQNDLFVVEGKEGFRLLLNTNGTFNPAGDMLPGIAGSKYTRALVGDLDNDRLEEVLVLGDPGSQVFKIATNGSVRDVTAFFGLKGLSAADGALADLDFTGKLDLLAITPGTNGLRVFRNLGNLFTERAATSGVPASVTGVRQLVFDDWNDDDLSDLFLTRAGQPPQLLVKQRGGTLALTNSPADWPSGSVIAVGDLNNDLRTDLVIATGDKLECILSGVSEHVRISIGEEKINSLKLIDYDNDGWLDICAVGEHLRVWRNLGRGGFQEMTQALGLDKIVTGKIESLAAADFDNDGDTDLLLSIEGRGLQLLRNDGGNANHQLKLRLLGTRSNASGLGLRIEVTVGGLRISRTVTSLPIEIGVGRYTQLDSLKVRWSDLAPSIIDVPVSAQTELPIIELQLPTGSCPYLYAWDGKRFRFVTDLLGAAPLGLRISDDRFIDADADEFVRLGDESLFQPREGNYTLQITEELREVLYLDAASMLVVDHPAGTEVHTTGKLRPGKPFPPHEIVTLHRRTPLKQAVRSDGLDVTDRLNQADGKLVSPIKLRIPQLRGLAEPYSVTLDFGGLAVDRPLVLALTGWLRFGGGMANVGASHNPELPFPFPTLEVETSGGNWKPLDVVVGAPAGKTKTILVDLAGKLPPGSQRLRLTTAFEIHWDRIALFERFDAAETKIARLSPETADLHWRGFSEYADLPGYFPLTPEYEKVRQTALWRITPMGWCTRYGDVLELIGKRDNALALLNGGDELTLKFSADRLPPKPSGYERDFFLYTSGWDKDADFHCELGWLVEPLPWHGMDDQLYGRQTRPAIDSDGWIKKYNTRWVGPLTLQRQKKR